MALSFEFLQGASSNTNDSTYTFAAQALGVADAARHIVVAVCGHRQSGNQAITSVTVGGVAASSVVANNNLIQIAALYVAAVPLGTTGDVVVTFAVNNARCGIALYRIVGTPELHDSDTSSATDPTVNLDIPADGVAIGVGFERTSGSATWTGLTERWDAAIEAATTATSAGDGGMGVETGRAITINFTGANVPIGAFASFSEAVGGEIFGDLAVALGNATLASTIVVGVSDVIGDLAVTLGNAALSATAEVVAGSGADELTTIERWCYPTTAVLVPVAEKLNLQTLLDANGIIRLDSGADYATDGIAGLTITSGQEVYGFNETKLPPITIAGGTVGAIVSNVFATLTFPSSAAITRDCIFTRCKGGVTVTDGCVERCLFTSMEVSRLSVIISTAGRFFRYNRYIRARAQGGLTTHIVLNGDAAKNSHSNVFVGYSSLTPNARWAEIYDQQDVAFIGFSCEEWNWTNSTTAAGVTVSDVEDLRIFATNGRNFNNPTPAFDSGATNFTLLSSIVYNNGGDDVAFQDAAERYLFSQGFWYGLTNSAANAFKLENFRQGNEALNVDGVGVTGELSASQKTHLEGMLSNVGRVGQPWSRYTFPTIPDPAGPNWDDDLASKPDNTAALQAIISANGVIAAGTYYITAPLVMNSGRSIRGSGADSTCIIAKTATFNMVEFNDHIVTSLGAFVRITDITLQGGLNGVYADDVGMGPLAQITQSLISHVTFRSISGAAITVKHIYGVDNCFVDYVNFVSCGTGFLQIPNPAETGEVESAYIDKVNFYRCQWVNNAKGIDWPARRVNNTNGWTECLFQGNTSWAIRFLNTAVSFFVNCDFINNAGNSTTATVDATGAINFTGCYFAPGANGTVLLDAAASYVNLEGCTFDGVGSTGAAIFDASSNLVSALNCTKNASLGLGTITEGTLFNCAFGSTPYDKFGVNIRGGVATVFDSTLASPQGSQFLWGPELTAPNERDAASVITLADAALSSVAQVEMVGVSAITLDDVVLSSVIVVPVVVDASILVEGAVLVSAVQVDAEAAGAVVLENSTLSASAQVAVIGIGAVVLGDAVLDSSVSSHVDAFRTRNSRASVIGLPPWPDSSLDLYLDRRSLAGVYREDTQATGASAITLAGATLNSVISVAATGEVILTAAVALDDSSLVAEGLVEVAVEFGFELEGATLAAAIAVDAMAVVGITLDNSALSAVGQVEVMLASAIALDDSSLAAVGQAVATTDTDVTLANAEIAAAVESNVAAASAIALEDATLSATSEVDVVVAGAITLEDAALSTTGEVDVVATGAVALDDASAAGAISLGTAVVLLAAVTLDDSTLNGTASADIVSVGAITLDDATTSMTGGVDVVAAGAVTLDGATATGIITSEAATTLLAAITLDGSTLSATGQASVDAISTIALDGSALSAAGQVDATAAGAVSLDGAVLNSTMALAGTTVGNLALSLSNATLQSVGTVELVANSSIVLGDAACAVAAKVNVQCAVAVTLDDASAASAVDVTECILAASITLNDASLVAAFSVTECILVAGIALDNAVLNSAGAVDVVCAGSVVLAPSTLQSSGRLAVAVGVAIVLNDATLASLTLVAYVSIPPIDITNPVYGVTSPGTLLAVTSPTLQ